MPALSQTLFVTVASAKKEEIIWNENKQTESKRTTSSFDGVASYFFAFFYFNARTK